MRYLNAPEGERQTKAVPQRVYTESSDMKPGLTEFAIRERLIETLTSLEDAQRVVFFREMFIQNFARRADLVVANGKLVAFEIKSARDTLERLRGQIGVYAEHFEQVTVVAATRHLRSVLGDVPESIGVWEVLDSGDLVVHREAPERRVTKSKWLTFLPVDELRALVRASGKSTLGNREDLATAAQTLPRDAIRNYVLAYMKRRPQRVDALRRRRIDTRVTNGERVSGLEDAKSRLDRFVASLQTGEELVAIPRQVVTS